MKHFTNSKAQSSTIAGLMIALVVVSGAAILLTSYIVGVATNYGVSVNESEFGFFNQTQRINNLTSEMTDQFVNENAAQTGLTDVISTMIGNAYATVKLFFRLPSFFSSLISAAFSSLGIPASVSGVLSWMLITVITIIILFAAYEAIMKVRS